MRQSRPDIRQSMPDIRQSRKNTRQSRPDIRQSMPDGRQSRQNVRQSRAVVDVAAEASAGLRVDLFDGIMFEVEGFVLWRAQHLKAIRRVCSRADLVIDVVKYLVINLVKYLIIDAVKYLVINVVKYLVVDEVDDALDVELAAVAERTFPPLPSEERTT